MGIPPAVSVAALAELPSQLAILDENFEIIYTNTAWKNFGVENDYRGDASSIGEHYLENIPFPEDHQPIPGLKAVMSGDKSVFTWEYPCHSPEKKRWFMMWARGFDVGDSRYLLVLHLDITERRLAEEAANGRIERLQTVAGILSHDLRNPLNIAQGNLQLLEENPASEDAIGAIQRSLERMEAIVAEAISLAEIELLSDETVETVDLETVARDSWTTIQTGDVTLDVESSRSFKASKTLVGNIFENLFANAIKHGGDVSVITVGTLKDGFFIEDDGCGIDSEHRNSIFEPGYSTDSSGSGLGLSIVEQIVTAHGWTIDLSEATSGARFEIRGVEWAD